MKIRCEWANASESEAKYHDDEWGVPCHDDQQLFEMLTLEGAQAGLSWATILNKREGYRKAFANFNIKTVAAFDEAKIESLLLDTSIVRHRLKINATVNNAQRILAMQKQHGSFDAYIWSFVNNTPSQPERQTIKEVPSSTATSDAMSRSLKKNGFKFIGSTTCYAFMQASGMVNDHLVSCFCYADCADQ